MYIITNINQNTPEWHKWRSQGIGGSDANIIMGVSEYSNIIDLWNLKTGKTEYKDNSNFLTRMGHQAEEWARGLFEYESGFCFPSVLGQDEKKAWMRISYDGYNKGANEVWECKLLGEKPFEILKEGKVPEKYYPQVQYQMHVPKADHNYLYGVKYVKGSDFRKTETYCLKVDYNAEYCHDLLEPALDKFWENVQNNTMPEPDNNSVLVIQDSQLKKTWHYGIGLRRKQMNMLKKKKRQKYVYSKTTHEFILKSCAVIIK